MKRYIKFSAVLALALCLCFVFTGCIPKSITEKNKAEQAEKEPIDVSDLLQDAYKKNLKSSSLTLSVKTSVDSEFLGLSTEKTIAGNFGQNEKGEFAAHVSLEDGISSEQWYYRRNVRYHLADGDPCYEYADANYDIESCCMEQWLLPALGVGNFRQFANTIENYAPTVEQGSKIVVTLECNGLETERFWRGGEYDTWYSSLTTEERNYYKSLTYTLSFTVNQDGYLSQIKYLGEADGEQNELTVKFSRFDRTAPYEMPDWTANALFFDGNELIAEENPPFTNEDEGIGGEAPPYVDELVTMLQSNFLLCEGESFSIVEFIKYAHCESLNMYSLNPIAVQVRNGNELYARQEGEADILLVATGGGKTQRIDLHITVYSADRTPEIVPNASVIVVAEGFSTHLTSRICDPTRDAVLFYNCRFPRYVIPENDSVATTEHDQYSNVILIGKRVGTDTLIFEANIDSERLRVDIPIEVFER